MWVQRDARGPRRPAQKWLRSVARDGFVRGKADRIPGHFAEERGIGRVMSNDSGKITERGPDAVREADVCCYGYRQAGVSIVLALDPEPGTAHVFGADEPPRSLGTEDELALPGILDGFRVRVGRSLE